MVQPTLTVRLGNSDITTRVSAPDSSTPSARWDRGSSFDGQVDPPGTVTVLVQNADRAFNPRNGSSSFLTDLKIGKYLNGYATHPTYQWSISSSNAADNRITTSSAHGLAPGDTVRISGHSGSTPNLNADDQVFSTPTSTTFTLDAGGGELNITTGGTGGTVQLLIPQFSARLTRIVPLDNGWAELHAIDDLQRLGQVLDDTELSAARTIQQFRADLVDAYLDGNHDLAGGTPELDVPVTYSGERSVLEVLTDLNRATGTMHYLKPIPNVSGGGTNPTRYTTVDRTQMEIGASVDTWSDADASKPFAVALREFDYTEEGIINRQQAMPARTRHAAETQLWIWEDGPATLVEFVTEFETIIASGFDPADELNLVVDATGSVTANTFNRGESVLIDAGPSGTATLNELTLRGRPYVPRSSEITVEGRDGTSISTYEEHAGELIRDNPFLHTRTAAKNLVDYIVRRWGQPRSRFSMTFQNRESTQLFREPGDIVSITSTELSLSVARVAVSSFETSVLASGGIWQTEYQLEELPALPTLGIYDTSTYDNAVYGD